MGFSAVLAMTCAMAASRASADILADLAPEAGNVETQRGYATGVQIYHSVQSPTDPTQFVWKFFAPDATLVNSGGKAFIHHFGGPTWQSLMDGSAVVGTLSKAQSPDPNSIAWLLLKAASNSGNGSLSEVTFIQRINTVGGLAPREAPTSAGLEVKVPYTATYVFFAKG